MHAFILGGFLSGVSATAMAMMVMTGYSSVTRAINTV